MKNRRMLVSFLAPLAAAFYLSGCTYVTGGTTETSPAESRSETASQTAAETAGEETSAKAAAEESAQAENREAINTSYAETETEEAVEEEVDLHTALFRSGASVVQMEITTGLTTEYLDGLCNYPVKVYLDGKVETVEDEAGLKKIGLEALYSDALVAAVKDFDTESLEIKDGKAIMGDSDHYVVLEMDEYENVGITEFHE